jgi:acyl-ACP thioesterase
MEIKKYKPVFTGKFTVRSFDIGLNARMRLSSVCSYFQEIAGKHATHLDAGYRVMHDSNRVWVLSKLFMEISRFPSWNTNFEVETWPLGTERIFFRRDYLIRETGETLISATSYWILLDFKSNRPAVFNLNQEVLKENSGRHAMEMPLEVINRDTANVLSTENHIHRVVYSDIDQNRHVNNASYVAWIMDCFQAEFHEKFVPSFFAIEYRQQVKAGDTVEFSIQQLKGEKHEFNVEGRIAGTGQVCIRSCIRFSAIVT